MSLPQPTNGNAVADYKFTPAQLRVIKNTYAKDLNDDEFNVFTMMCGQLRLSPVKGQICAVVYNKDKADKRKVTFITQIGGLRSIAARSGRYRADDAEPVFTYDEKLKSETNPLGIVSCSVKVFYQDSKGDWYPAVGTAYWDEYAPIIEEWKWNQESNKRQPTGKMELGKDNWKKMGRIMLAKCAESVALRKAFPEDLSHIFTEEEMEKATVIDATASEIVAEEEKNRRLSLTKSADSIPLVLGYGEAIQYVPLGKVADTILEAISKLNSAAEIVNLRETNRHSLRNFWALAKADALEVNEQMEKRIKQLGETK